MISSYFHFEEKYYIIVTLIIIKRMISSAKISEFCQVFHVLTCNSIQGHSLRELEPFLECTEWNAGNLTLSFTPPSDMYVQTETFTLLDHTEKKKKIDTHAFSI